ncbi:unnamed protein product [Lactuca virosa]|uniref:Metalloenzyme domain-containing protein n=1 Tax=Lactuca virosa TaxID=75947 RepID=A0AAU9LI40_9ASTR|nr:unnamed protein product [Lactuca virosa]
MVAPQKNVPADKRLETVEENLGKILDEQQQQKLVNQQQARAIEDNKIMQNEMMRKLDALLGKVEKIERGKGNETPNSGILTPEFNPRDKNSGQGSSGDGGADDYIYHTLAVQGSGELCLKYIFSFGIYARSPLLERCDYLSRFEVRLNIPNGGMVGHTGDVEANVVACKAAKEVVKMILDVVDQVGGIFVVTVDHGNVEDMVKMNKKGEHVLDKEGNVQILTSHTLQPVS